MSTIKMTVERQFTIAEIDDRLYSSFIEHLGRAVYSGIYEPDIPGRRAGLSQRRDRHGRDLDEPRPLSGGNFLSGYEWTDGSVRATNVPPARPRLAHLRPNLIGIDEFVDWARRQTSASWPR
jgi:alpha-N-arabinofuranosidase